MPPKQQQSKITSFFGQQLERPSFSFTSPPRPGDSDNYGDSSVVMPQTPSQSPGVIVPGTPPTPLSLKVQPVPRSMSPRFVPDYTDHQVAHANRGLNAQFPPQVSGPTLSPSGTAQEFAAQLAYQQQQQQQYQQQQQQQQQEQEQEDPAAAARQRAALQAQYPDVLTQFQGGKTRSKMVKKSKKSNKRRNRRSKYRSRSRSKKSYFY
jgi:hypothetical protein